MASKVKVTFSLPVEIMEKYKKYAEKKYIVSVNSAVKEALEQYAQKIEKEELYRAMCEASQDPMFVKDLEESMEAFEAPDREATGRNGEW